MWRQSWQIKSKDAQDAVVSKTKKSNYGICWQTFYGILKEHFEAMCKPCTGLFLGLTHVVLPGSHMRQTAAPRQLSCCWKLYFTQLLHLLGPKPGLESQLWTQLSYVHWQRARTCNDKYFSNTAWTRHLSAQALECFPLPCLSSPLSNQSPVLVNLDDIEDN